MKKMILFAFGTRPEAIKMAPLIRRMKQDSAFRVKVCVTAQHREMLDQVLEFFEIHADYDLNLMTSGQTLEELTARILIRMSEIVEQVKPDLIFVQGDTTTVLASALAGFYKGVPIAHLEAGLRTHNKLSPFPEEVNRILTSHLTDYHFAPTAQAVANLTAEGICANVYRVGNTVIDALHIGLDIIRRENTGEYSRHFDFLNPEKKIILITGHRRESFGEPFKNICEALRDIATAFPAVQLVYPVHLNPNVKNVVYSRLKGIANVHLIAPLPYPQLIWLMEKSYMVLTDSGGIQEEAPALGKPVLVMREHTERQEGVDAGTARLVGTDRARIYQAVSELLTDAAAYTTIANAVNPYGDGTASEQVIKILKEHLGDAQ